MNTRPEALLGGSESARDIMEPAAELGLSLGDAVGESKVGSIPDVLRRVEFGCIGGKEL